MSYFVLSGEGRIRRLIGLSCSSSVANQNQLCAADLGKEPAVPVCRATKRAHSSSTPIRHRSPVQTFARSQAREEVGQGVRSPTKNRLL